MRKLVLVAATIAALMVGTVNAAACGGQLEVMEPNGGITLIEADGEVTHIGYSDGSVESVLTPESADHWSNLQESISKGCTTANMFEDYSCKGPGYYGYGFYG